MDAWMKFLLTDPREGDVDFMNAVLADDLVPMVAMAEAQLIDESVVALHCNSEGKPLWPYSHTAWRKRKRIWERKTLSDPRD